MSTTIDEKVVEMRFDNKHFEKHTRETMSTLDKLKQKLNLTGASKSFENINTSANKVNLSGMSNAVDTVRSRFSALEVMGVTALANITNSAVNAGKRIVSALTIDPVKTGFNEYETQINAVQTIMANVKHKGKTLENVNAALDELNKYADQTIYNFTEMTRNIGLFTNAGVDLDTAVNAIKGFSNAAAMAGTNATDTSRAMYQLSQAMSSGSVKLLDWRSLETANITGERFQETIKETAKVHGINVDEMIEKEGNFRETLASGWLTADLMAEALNHYTLSRETMTEAEQKASKEQLLNIGYTEEQIEKLFDLGTEASNAATKVKTFTQLFDVLKEAAQSGWSQTWRLIVGDFEEAKAIFTPLADFLTGIINRISTARNSLLEAALGNPFTSLLDKLNVSDSIKNISTLSRSLEYYQDMVNRVWRGDYKNQPYRKGLLEAEGHNFSVIQTLVNKGYQYELTLKDVEEAERKYGITAEKTTKTIKKLSDAKLKELGLTEDEIKLYRDLEDQAIKTGKPISELIEAMNAKDGRTLLIESVKNAGEGLVTVLTALGEAWRDVFPPMSSVKLYFMIEAINKFSESLKVGDETAVNIRDTFKGLFALLDIFLTLTTGPVMILLKLFLQILKAMDIGILEFTGKIGNVIYEFNKWLHSILDFTAVFKALIPYVEEGIKRFNEWFKSLKNTEPVKKFIDSVMKAKDAVAKWIDGFRGKTPAEFFDWLKSIGDKIKNVFVDINKHFNGVPKDLLMGLINGIKTYSVKVFEVIIEFGLKLIEKFKDVFDINSPSKVFFAIGGFIIAGLIGGLLAGSGKLGDTVGEIATNIVEFFNNINWSKVISTGMTAGMFLIAKKLLDIIDNVTGPLGSLGDLLDNVSDVVEDSRKNIQKILKNVSKVVKSFSKVLNGIAFEHKTEGIKNLAISLLILVGAFAILTLLDTDKMLSSVGILMILAGVLIALTVAMNLISDASVKITKKGVKVSGIKSALLFMGLAMVAVAAAIKMLGGMDPDYMVQGLLGLVGVVVALGTLMLAYGKLIKGDAAKNMDLAGKMMKKMAVSLLLMAIVVKLVGKMEWGEMGKAAAFIAGFLAFVALLFTITMIPGNNIDKLGGMLIGVSFALLLMVTVVKYLNLLNIGEIIKGVAFAAGFVVFVGALVKATQIGNDKQIAKVGLMLLGISMAMLIMVGVIKLISLMEWGEMYKGVVGIVGLGLIISGLMWVVKRFGAEAPKLAGTLLALSLAIGILAAIAIGLSLIDPKSLAKGLLAVSLFGGCIALMLQATKGTKNASKNLTAMSVAIGVMAVSVAVLSFIDWKKLLPAAAGMAVLMGMFALIENQSKHITKSLGPLIVMTVAIGVIAGALYLIAQLPADKAIAASTSLSALMISLAASMFVISKTGELGAKSLLGIVGILALVGTLYLVVHVLSTMQNIENAAQNATVLAAFMGALSIIQILCAAAGAIYTATGGVAMLGLVGMLALIGELYLVMGVLAIMSNIPDAVSNLEALTSFMIVMTAVLVALAVVGPLAVVGVAAMNSLLTLMGVIGVLAVAIGALLEWCPDLETFLDKGLPIFVKLAGGIGDMIGAFVGGIMTEIAKDLPAIGTCLSLFMVNATPFITGAKMIDEQVGEGVKTLVTAVLALTTADLISGVAAFLSNGKSFATLGSELSAFMFNALPFIAMSKTIDPAIMTGVKTLAEAILILTGADLLQRLTSLIGGETSLSSFGVQLSFLGDGLSGFVEKLDGFGEEQVKMVNSAGEAIKSLANVANEIPGQGGWLQKIAGEQNLATFGTQLGFLGSGLKMFITNIGEFGKSQASTVEHAGEAVLSLAKAANEIPGQGGWWQKIAGEQNLGTFATQLAFLGSGLKNFVINLGEFDDGKIETVKSACGAIGLFADLANSLPTDGGWWQKIFGGQSLSEFGSQLGELGTNLKEFVGNLGVFSTDQVGTVTSACNAIRAFTSLNNIDIENTGDDLEAFGKNMVDFAKKVKTFVDTIGEASSISIDAAIIKTQNLINMASSLAGINIESIKTFGESLKEFAKDGVKGFVEEFSGESPKTKAANAIEAMIDAAIKAAKGKKDDVVDGFEVVAGYAIDGLESKSVYSDAKEIGKNLIQGFCVGIDENTWRAEARAAAMAKAALQAANDALDVNSPSKEFYKTGKFSVLGFTNALVDGTSKAYNAGYDMAETAKTGLSKAISRVSDIINSDIDSQPTIRPVLDLSDVESGAGYLSSMFNDGPSIGVMANLRSISSGMNSKIQNGTNNDVVSAINKLRKDLGNVSGNTYNVNGVTYDDGSNITNAVKELVRAVKIEGRV